MKERAQLVGGTLEIESAPGKGTTVFVRVPAASVKGKNPMENKLQILIAEDHETVREGVKLIVEAQKDMEVVGLAGDGRAAVELARTFSRTSF
jgi:hypothetical protein